ncbi:MAG TPA: purine-nucleoside phosphorylase [Gemmatimonadaceae bacterium]
MNEITRDDLPSAHDVASRVRDALAVDRPIAGLVLGSGLGGLTSRIEDQRFVPYADLPGFAVPTIPGHLGRLISGTLGGRQVLALAGRFHVYEGYSAAQSAFPVRVLHALGAPILFLSNAAGGIRRSFKPGDLMIIRDHVNLTWRNPLIGPIVPGDERFPDMSDPWDPALRRVLAEGAAAAGVEVSEGVYCGLSGPSYETPAEVRMLEKLGVDAVGMSTVHEVIVARAIGMRVAGMSCITNLAAGLSEQSVSHEEVLEVTKAAGERFERVAVEFVARL